MIIVVQQMFRVEFMSRARARVMGEVKVSGQRQGPAVGMVLPKLSWCDSYESRLKLKDI